MNSNVLSGIFLQDESEDELALQYRPQRRSTSALANTPSPNLSHQSNSTTFTAIGTKRVAIFKLSPSGQYQSLGEGSITISKSPSGSAISVTDSANDPIYVASLERSLDLSLNQGYWFLPPNESLRLVIGFPNNDAESLFSLIRSSFPSPQTPSSSIPSSSSSSASIEIKELQQGTGRPISEGDTVRVKYTGWLEGNQPWEKGEQFDSNVVDKPMKVVIGKGNVIVGFEKGLIGMNQGSYRLIRIPPSLGYGPQGAPPRIPGNSTLLFELNVDKIKYLETDETPSATPAPRSRAQSINLVKEFQEKHQGKSEEKRDESENFKNNAPRYSQETPGYPPRHPHSYPPHPHHYPHYPQGYPPYPPYYPPFAPVQLIPQPIPIIQPYIHTLSPQNSEPSRDQSKMIEEIAGLKEQVALIKPLSDSVRNLVDFCEKLGSNIQVDGDNQIKVSELEAKITILEESLKASQSEVSNLTAELQLTQSNLIEAQNTIDILQSLQSSDQSNLIEESMRLTENYETKLSNQKSLMNQSIQELELKQSNLIETINQKDALLTESRHLLIEKEEELTNFKEESILIFKSVIQKSFDKIVKKISKKSSLTVESVINITSSIIKETAGKGINKLKSIGNDETSSEESSEDSEIDVESSQDEVSESEESVVEIEKEEAENEQIYDINQVEKQLISEEEEIITEQQAIESESIQEINEPISESLGVPYQSNLIESEEEPVVIQEEVVISNSQEFNEEQIEQSNEEESVPVQDEADIEIYQDISEHSNENEEVIENQEEKVEVQEVEILEQNIAPLQVEIVEEVEIVQNSPISDAVDVINQNQPIISNLATLLDSDDSDEDFSVPLKSESVLVEKPLENAPQSNVQSNFSILDQDDDSDFDFS
ncbi:hypothetical protein RCL1_004030 [Eukaryota sp. TZLM3-RCL]